ncbi:MAG: FG-GAP repeat domain-containing protein [Bryobacteraceae bacterium]
MRSAFFVLLAIVLFCLRPATAQPKSVTFGVPAEYSAGLTQVVGGFATSPIAALTVDLNHDGYGDFVTVDWTAGTIVVVLGAASGFQAPASYPAVTHPLSIASGDFNRDGNPDLLVVGETTVVMLGTGNGGFQAPVTIYSATANYGAVGDFNGDGNADIAICGPGHLLVALGNGHGTFKPFVLSPMPEPWAFYPGSFHNNGRDDLLLVQRKAPVCLLTSNGDGTFQQGPPISGGTWGIAVADMNNDGNQDFVTIGGPTAPVQVWLGDGQGNFTPTASQPDGFTADFVTVADVNGDGIPDVVTADEGSAVSIFLGEGGGKLQAGYSYKANGGPVWAGVGRYFGSDTTDIVALGWGDRIAALTLSILRNTAGGDYEGVRNIELSHAGSFAVGDLNGDGIPDLLVANVGYDSSAQAGLWILPGAGDGTFGKPSVSLPLPAFASSPVIADFNADGTPDFAVTLQSYMATTIDVGLQQPGNTFNIVSTNLPESVSIAWAGDLNGDGLPDLVLVNTDCFDSSMCGTVYTLLNAGNGTFGSPVQITTSDGRSTLSFLAVADFNNDGKPDLAVGAVAGCGSGDGPAVLLGNGDGTFGAPTCLESQFVYALVAGDFNQDGNQDLALETQDGSELQVLLGNGNGGFHKVPPQPFHGPSGLLFATDLNGDGFPDLAWVTSTNYGYDLQIYLGTGTGGFALEAVTYPTSGFYGQVYAAQLADLTNVGKIDLVTLSGAFSILLNTTQ